MAGPDLNGRARPRLAYLSVTRFPNSLVPDPQRCNTSDQIGTKGIKFNTPGRGGGTPNFLGRGCLSISDGASDLRVENRHLSHAQIYTSF